MEHKRYTVGITIGDFNGIGPEVIIKTLEDERIFKFCSVIIYGQKNIISFYTRHLKIQNFNVNELTETWAVNPKIPNVVNCWTEQVQVTPGTLTTEGGNRAMICLNEGIKH